MPLSQVFSGCVIIKLVTINGKHFQFYFSGQLMVWACGKQGRGCMRGSHWDHDRMFVVNYVIVYSLRGFYIGSSGEKEDSERERGSLTTHRHSNS